MMRIRKLFRFEAAHVLPYHDGKCKRLHGHSYRLEVELSGTLKQSGPDCGMVMDFGDISDVVNSRVINKLDHQNLNDIIDNPTCERMVEWVVDALKIELPELSEITLWETATACASMTTRDRPFQELLQP